MLSPKTKGPGASQQLARIDDPLITDLLTSVCGNMPAEQPLWPLSPSAFRSRFRALGKGLGLPETFPPASSRSSVATFLYEMTENTDLVARRGRWMSQKTTNIYLQEVHLSSLGSTSQKNIESWVSTRKATASYGMPPSFSIIALTTTCGHPCLLAHLPTEYQNARLQLSRVILCWDFGIMGQPLSRGLCLRRSGDRTCRAASVASSSDFEGWELTDTA